MRRHAEVLHQMGRYKEAATLLPRCQAFRVQQDGKRNARSAWLWLRIAATHFAADNESSGGGFLAMACRAEPGARGHRVISDYKHLSNSPWITRTPPTMKRPPAASVCPRYTPC